MAARVFEALLLESAEEMDREGHPGQIALLKESYDFFKEAGLSEKEIGEVMALTREQLHMLAELRAKMDGSQGSFTGSFLPRR